MKANRRTGKGSLEMIEEAVHLLRRAPFPILAVYYLGSLPFVLALLFFLADMSRNPFAHRLLVGGALGMAAMFVWMKSWQAVFARQLRAFASNRPLPVLNLRRFSQILFTQSVLQPTGLFL